ncbi:MAG: hypothetical protein E6F98_01205 [Actinobacteria bacterium]|nr:MAG: hypothetical protein E6F98_01205 [Actinomycetota bacterium]
MEWPPVGGEALQQRAPVAEALVQSSGRLRPVVGKVELDARPPRRVLDPVAPQRPRVGEHGIEVERDCVHGRPC